MEKFEIGEIAIHWRPGSFTHGVEVKIISMLKPIGAGGIDQLTDLPLISGILAYDIDDGHPVPGFIIIAEPHELRKKPKPRDIDKIVSWNDCDWRPETVAIRK